MIHVGAAIIQAILLNLWHTIRNGQPIPIHVWWEMVKITTMLRALVLYPQVIIVVIPIIITLARVPFFGVLLKHPQVTHGAENWTTIVL